jgi:hypothetical protein
MNNNEVDATAKLIGIVLFIGFIFLVLYLIVTYVIPAVIAIVVFFFVITAINKDLQEGNTTSTQVTTYVKPDDYSDRQICRKDVCTKCDTIRPDRCEECGRCLSCYHDYDGLCTYCEDDRIARNNDD